MRGRRRSASELVVRIMIIGEILYDEEGGSYRFEMIV